MTSCVVLTPKGTSLHGKTSFELWSVRIGPTVRTGHVPKKKGQNRTVKKVGWALGVIFNVLGRSPTELICTEICTVVAVPDVITCAKFWTKFSGVTVLQGVEFPIFCYWFLHGPYNSAALMRCLWFDARLSVVVISCMCDACLIRLPDIHVGGLMFYHRFFFFSLFFAL